MSADQILTPKTAPKTAPTTQLPRTAHAILHSDEGQQVIVLLILTALALIIPLSIENSSIAVQFGILAIILPVTAVWYTSTAPPPSASATSKISTAQWIRWTQYLVIIFGFVWAKSIVH